MKIKIEYEGEDDKLTPINMAKAIYDFMAESREHDKMWVTDFKEMVEYLVISSKFLRMRDSKWEF